MLIARILAAAAFFDGMNVVQTQSMLGDSQRGGLVISEVVIDRDEIIFQQVEQPDVIVALSDMAIRRYGARDASIVTLYENGLADLAARERLYGFPFAEEATKHGYAANMMARG